MNCKSCGKELKEGTKFCDSCGTKVEVQKKSSNKGAIIFFIVIGVIILLTAIGFSIFILIMSKRGIPKDDISYTLIETNYEIAAQSYIRENKYYNLDYTKDNYVVLNTLKNYYEDSNEERRNVALACRGYVELVESTGSAPNVEAYISCGQQFNADYETEGYDELKHYSSSINLLDEEEISKINGCPNYIENSENLKLESKYVFSYDYKGLEPSANGPEEYTVTYYLELYLYDNNIMNIKEKNAGQAMDTNIWGTYQISNNTLTINRDYFITDATNCSVNSPLIENKSEYFTIENDTLRTNKYNASIEKTYSPNSLGYSGDVILKKIN